MLSTLKKCPFSIVAGHETTIEMNQGSLSYHVAMMSMVRELNRDTNTEEMFTHFKELLNGKCQRQNASDILEFWFSLQASIKSLPVSFRYNTNDVVFVTNIFRPKIAVLVILPLRFYLKLQVFDLILSQSRVIWSQFSAKTTVNKII
jgi:hypothetical protein